MAQKSYIGRGKVYAKGRTGGLLYLGDTPSLKIEIKPKEYKQLNSDSVAGGILNQVTLIEDATATIEMTSFSPENMAKALYGESASVAGSTVSDEYQRAYLDGLIALNNPGELSSVTVTGVDPIAWAAGIAAASLGFYRKGVAPAGSYLFLCTTAGTGVTSGAGPTTIVLGDTYTDANGSVWENVGLAAVSPVTGALVSGTDYVIEGTGIYIPETSSIVDGQVVDVDYTYGDTITVQAMTQSAQSLRLVFNGLNLAEDGKPRTVEIFKWRPTPTSSNDLKMDDYSKLTLTGSILADTTKTGTDSQYFVETFAV